MKYILSHSYSLPSARLLRDEMQKIMGDRILVTSHAERVRGELLVRYGSTERVAGRDTEFNSPAFISTCASKSRFSDLANHNGLWAPDFHSSGTPTSFPVLIRTTLTSSGGRGIIVCNNLGEFRSNWSAGCHWTEFVRTSSEFRVHILGGKIAKVFKKVRNEGMSEEDVPIRNLHRGYHFSLVQNVEGMDKMVALVTKLSSVVGGKFYALDCGYNRDRHEYFCFEINSAPGLNEDTSSRYANFIVNSLYPGRFSDVRGSNANPTRA